MRVLLFDDNGVVRSILSRVLTQQGSEVLDFPHPVACPLYHSSSCRCDFSEICADVIITDFDMPHMDGLRFIEKLLEKGCRIKNLALLSESRDTSIIARAEQLGFKVFSKADGISALMEWLRQVGAKINSERRLTRWSAT